MISQSASFAIGVMIAIIGLCYIAIHTIWKKDGQNEEMSEMPPKRNESDVDETTSGSNIRRDRPPLSRQSKRK